MVKAILSVISLAFFISINDAEAISVDKLVVVSTESKANEILVNNEADYPVFVEVELSELNLENGQELKFDSKDFKKWPIYIDKREFVIDPKSRMILFINDLVEMLGGGNDQDRVIGISVVPRSYKVDDKVNNRLNILTGYKIWYIIPNNNNKVMGQVKLDKIDNENYSLFNGTDTTINFEIDGCNENKEINNDCSESLRVLPKKSKNIKIDKDKFKNVTITSNDFRNRYHQVLNIN